MAVLRIPTPLRAFSDGRSDVQVAGPTVGEALADLTRQYPALRPHLFNEAGELRPFVNLYINEENIRDMQGVSTQLKENDRLMLIPSIAGG